MLRCDYPPKKSARCRLLSDIPMPSPTSRAKRTAQERERRAVLERRALELSKQCPVNQANPTDCPLAGVRPLVLSERRKWIQRLSDEELEYLGAYHSCCLTEKLAAEHR